MKKYKAPDKKAPRFRVGRYTLTTEAVFDKFRIQHPEYREYTNKQLVEIIDTYHEHMWNEVVNYRDGVELPEKLGHVFIGTCKPKKGSNPDRKLSIEHKQEISHRNFPSDNFLAKIFYTNFLNKYLFADREIWEFRAVREFKKKVATSYPEKWKMYHIIDNFKYISDLYNEKKLLNYLKSKDFIPEGYNEFAL